MILVLADDFSGAAEIAGIGHRYGLQTEIQVKLEWGSHVDLIVLDTNSRSLSEDGASKRISEIASIIKGWNKPIRLFKKIDSVMRGHITAELVALQQIFGFKRILLLPANPGRERKILGGNYWVEGKPLHETLFAQDPDFPTLSPAITSRIGSNVSTLRHIHLSPESLLPSSGFITGDVASKSHLKKYVAATTDMDLCCGAAELFESYLENLGYHPHPKKKSFAQDISSALIVNGSAAKNPAERELFRRRAIPEIPLPGNLGVEFELQREDAIKWHQKILDAMHNHRVVAVSIDHPVQHNKHISGLFLNYLGDLMRYITNHIPMDQIHFCLTGGATASFLLAQYSENKYFVHQDVAPGVVSLVLQKDGVQQGLVTVKPGSYAWPEWFIESLASTENNKWK